MPAASLAGVTMDERIRNLMRERGHENLLSRVDDPDLEDRIVASLNVLDSKLKKFKTPLADRRS